MKTRSRDSRRRCPLCRADLGADKLTPCSGCGTEYHTDCMQELGGCSTRGCPRRHEPTSSPQPHAKQERDVEQTEGLAEEDPFARLCSHTYLSAISDQALKIDPTSRLEMTCAVCAAIPAILALLVAYHALTGDTNPAAIAIFALPALFLALLRKRIDNHWVFDFEARRVRYNSWFVFRFLRTIATFDQIAGFGVSGKRGTDGEGHSTGWEYFVVMILSNGGTRRLTDGGMQGLRAAQSIATDLATLSGTEAWLGEPEQRLRVRSRGGSVEVTYRS